MKRYKIAITETLRKIVEVKEENPSQAVSKVESRYDLEEIVLSYEEHCNTTRPLCYGQIVSAVSKETGISLICRCPPERKVAEAGPGKKSNDNFRKSGGCYCRV